MEIGFFGYLLICSDVDDIRKAIEIIFNGKRYVSDGVSDMASEYFKIN